MNTRDFILSQDSLPTDQVVAWGRTLTVRGLSGVERDRFEQLFLESKEEGKDKSLNVRGTLVALSVVDDEEKRVFTDKDATKLGSLSANELDKVFEVAMKLSGIGKKDMERIEGNSDGAPGAASSSSSPTDGDAVPTSSLPALVRAS